MRDLCGCVWRNVKNKNKTRKKLRVEESERKGKIREGKKKVWGFGSLGGNVESLYGI